MSMQPKAERLSSGRVRRPMATMGAGRPGQAVALVAVLLAGAALAACDQARYDAAAGPAPAAHKMQGQSRMVTHAAAPPVSIAPDAIVPGAGEAYAGIVSNPVTRVTDTPVSTFSVDVDTASYANVRRFLEDGQLPPADAVRVEELVNYFYYDYPRAESLDRPFSVTTELAPTPWNPNTHLLHVGLRGFEVAAAERPAANLVFLIDVSGSMSSPDKLPLVQRSLDMLTGELRPQDRVGIVVYAGAAGTVLEPTAGDRKGAIRAAIARLRAGGSTAGGEGLALAYDLAAAHRVEGGVNRVIMATDGDFNVGVTDPKRLEELIVANRQRGIALSVLGFGTGNYNDRLMEALSNAGDGNAAYIDSLLEARKVLVAELGATLLTIARDVKVQIEFNPARVAEYRLVGYENRLLREQDFADDRIDAGDIGAGHTVTAIYEIALTGEGGSRLPARRYAAEIPQQPGGSFDDELAYLELRYKRPADGIAAASRPIGQAIRADAIRPAIEQASQSFRFAAAVAAFGQLLRGGDGMGGYTLADAANLARDARGDDPEGYRSQFVQLAKLAQDLQRQVSQR